MNRKNLQNKKLSGFTLIELLVVITIIGILASIVVVNLNSARGKGQDTAIKEQMSQMRAQASLFYDDNFGYAVKGTTPGVLNGSTGSCAATADTLFENSDMQRSLTALKRNSGTSPMCYLSASTAIVPAQEWAVMTKLKTSDGYWCVDAAGNAIEVADTPIALTFVSTNKKCQ